MRQQRGARQRGQLQQPNQRPVPDISWTPQSAFGTTVTLTPNWDPTDLLLVGLPQFHLSSTNEFATGCAIAGGFIVLTFATGPTLPTIITLAAADPAIRTSQGAFLAAGAVRISTPDATVTVFQEIDWTASASGANVIVTPVGLVGESVFFDAFAFFDDTIGAAVAISEWDGTTLTLTMQTPPALGDAFTYAGEGLASWEGGGNTFKAKSVIL